MQVRHLYLKSESAAPYRHSGEPFQMFQMFQMFQNLERSKIWRCLAGVVRTGWGLIVSTKGAKGGKKGGKRGH